jgi:hypothetical protein
MAHRGMGSTMPQRESLPQGKRPWAGEGTRHLMVEIVRTSDLVLVGFLQSLLENANIPVFIADAHISALEGMIGAFPRRMMVPQDHVAQARRLIAEAGLSAELRHD